jgi:hypothetical protein
MKQTLSQIAVQIPETLIPKPGIDLQKWAVIACDQFTSEPEYWHAVEAQVGNAPSTLKIILPEVYLGQPDEAARQKQVVTTMQSYLSDDIFTHFEDFILVERTVGGKTRRGLMLALDLEKYDFKPGSTSLIRASEGTIVDRLPPRIKIREQALIESPHILVLIDDPQKTVVEPLVSQKEQLTSIYDFELMQGSGHLHGYQVNRPELQQQIIHAFEKLADPQVFTQKYHLKKDLPVLLFAVGDGNHSLATAKSVWEKMKQTVSMDHPARYALVEIENIHDAGLEFEPIHRLLFGVHGNIKAGLQAFYPGQVTFGSCPDQKELLRTIALSNSNRHCMGLITPQGFEIVQIQEPRANLAVGTLQTFLDDWLETGQADKIDYIHGNDVVFKLGSQPGQLGFILPAMAKEDLFKTVILDGVLPRKTFSMGEAHEKRFYLECRKIVE